LFLFLFVHFVCTTVADSGETRLPLLGNLITSICFTILPDAVPQKEGMGDEFSTLLRSGVNGIFLSFDWKELESSPGVTDTSILESAALPSIADNMLVHCQIKTVDTNLLKIPNDLVDSSNLNQLSSGLHWNDSKIIQRFKNVLSHVIPLIVKNTNVFLISIGNEVDGWLLTNPLEVDGYIQFVREIRDHIKSLSTSLGFGVSMTYKSMSARSLSQFYFVDSLFQLCDAIIITTSDGEKPSIDEVLADTITVAGSKYVVLQDSGFVSAKTKACVATVRSSMSATETGRSSIVSSLVRQVTDGDTSIADTWRLIPKWMRVTLFIFLITFCYL